MFQKLTIVGYLGTDPELRYTPSGQAVSHFSVATNRKWTDKDGQQQEETTWFRVSVWSKQAEACHQYLAKGRQVLIEGRLNPDPETGGPRVWTDQDGNPRASYDMTALEVKFLGSRDDSPGYAEEASASEPTDAADVGHPVDEISF